ncbi:MAG: hypothetical protein DRJ15_14195 [Bacteroidetes bacterium]|nr:MAG: hypothetical protein DRJ15_14195 [Bacteroidota bacterium]
MTPEQIVKRQEALDSERTSSVVQQWDDIERFVAPYRGDFYSNESSEDEVDWRIRSIYDSTAVIAAQNLAAAIHSNLTSPSIMWFDLRFKLDGLNEDKIATEWLEECGKSVWQALQESNFSLEIAEHYTDLTTMGTAALVEEMDDDEKKLIFQSVPIKELFFEEDSVGGIYRIYRKLLWTAVQIVDKFGEEDLPQQITDDLDKPESATNRHAVIFCIYPRKERKDADTSKQLAPSARPFGFKYILASAKEMLGEEGGYYEMPAYITRFRKTSGSKWGHAPGTDCMSMIMTANEIRESSLEALAKMVDPPLEAAEAGLFTDLDRSRGGVTMVRETGQIKPIHDVPRLDWAENTIAALQKFIRESFFQDQLDLKESPQMTATEVNARRQLMQRLLGPTLGRIQSDLLDPVISRTFNILYREGLLPEIPPVVSEAGAQLDIEYTGPMPMAQKDSDAMAILDFMNVTAQMAEIFPDVRHLPDPVAAMREYAGVRGVPAKALNGKEDVDKAVEADKQAAEQAQQQATMAQGAATLKDAGSGIASIGGVAQGGQQ